VIDRADSPCGHLRPRKAASALGLLVVVFGLIAFTPASRGDPGGPAGSPAALDAIRGLQQQGRWAESDTLAAAALGRLEHDAGADSLALATALLLHARAKWNLVGYADGSALLAATRCLGIRQRRLGPDHLEVAEVHQLVASLLLGSDRADSALVHVRKAIDIRTAQLAPTDTLLAVSWDALALVQRGRHDFRAALAAWTRAIDCRRRSDGPESPGVAALIGQTGLCLAELDDYEGARRVFHESLEMFARTSPEDPQRWIPLNLLADLERRTGNLALDVDLLREALRVVQLNYGENSRKALTVRFNLALGLFDLGDFEGASAEFAPLIPLTRAQYPPTHPMTTLPVVGLGRARAGAGDTATAMRRLREAETALASRPGVPDPNLPEVQDFEAELLYEQGRYAEAQAMVVRAMHTFSSLRSAGGQGRTSPGNYFDLTLTAAALGDTAMLDSARRTLAWMQPQIAARASRGSPTVAYYMARGASARGLGAEAWTRALEAERLARERLRENLQALPDRRALQFTRQQAGFLDLVLELSRGGGRDRQETAWDRLVRSRGLVRADLARRRTPLGYESDTAVVGAHDRWIEAQRVLAQRLVSGFRSSGDSLARAALERLRNSAEEAEGAYAQVLKSRGLETDSPDVGLAEVRARLRPGQALVAFVESRWDLPEVLPCPFFHDSSSVVAFVARGGEPAIERIEMGRSADLRAAIEPWRERLGVPPGPGAKAADAAERECRRRGLDVRAHTWDRVAGSLAGIGDVFIVGDGPLLDLAWQALPDGARAYLVEKGPRLHILNAERELLESVTPAKRASSGSLLALGSPDFDHGDAGTPQSAPVVASLVRSAPDACAGGVSGLLAPLPGSGAEAAEAARQWRARPGQDSELLLGRDATEAAFKREAHGRLIIHLATHGVVARDTCAGAEQRVRGVGGVAEVQPPVTGRRPGRPDAAGVVAVPVPSPWMGRRVWLALAGANRAAEHTQDENEGLLTSEEVLTLDLAGTDWVVLSACHSGLAERWSREGTSGMARAFQVAGARSVIASQWPIADDATGEWMAALYAARAAGEVDAAAAASAASRAVLEARRRSGRSTHPFFWAAFTTNGE
jgi:CHAT domain-containing protein/tetratricopeptide (TPR) repeat protein